MIFPFVRPGGVWPGEIVPGANDFHAFDVTQWKSVNGTLGGSWTPTSPIGIGGAGLQSSAAATLLSGGLTTGSGGRVIIAASAGDTPTLSPSRSRTVRVPVTECFTDPTSGSLLSIVRDDQHGWGIQAALTTGGGFPAIYWPIPGRSLHIGARLASVGLEYVVTKRPTAVPTSALSMLVQTSDDAASNLTYKLAPAPLINFAAWTPGWAGFSAGVYTTGSTGATANGLYFRSNIAGTTGSVEPTWPTVIGGTVNDNGITWTAIGRSGIQNLIGATPDSYFANGAPQVLEIDFDPTPVLSGVTTIWPVGARLEVAATQIDPSAVVTGLVLAFDTIGSMAFS